MKKSTQAQVEVNVVGKAIGKRALIGAVVSTKNAQTVIVSIVVTSTHAFYGKQMRRTKRVPAHVETGSFKVGDVVRIVPTKPYSKTKHYKVVESVTK